MRNNQFRLPIFEAGSDLVSNDDYKLWRSRESMQRLQDGQYLETNDTGNMGAVNTKLNAHEATGYLLPGFFELGPEDLRLIREEGEL